MFHSLAQVQAEVEHCFADDEDRENADVAAERHRYKRAKNDGDVKHDDSRVGLHHQDDYDGPAVLAAAEVVHEERPKMACDESKDTPPDPLLRKHLSDIGEGSEEAEVADRFMTEKNEHEHAVNEAKQSVVKDKKRNQEKLRRLVR